MWQGTIINVSSNPFWKSGTTSDIRNTVDVTKIQSQDAKLIGVLLEVVDVFLSALDNTLACSFSQKTRSEEFQ
jgi:hypothetical protein